MNNKLSRAERGGLCALAVIAAALCSTAFTHAPVEPEAPDYTPQQRHELTELIGRLNAPSYTTDAEKLAYLFTEDQ